MDPNSLVNRLNKFTLCNFILSSYDVVYSYMLFMTVLNIIKPDYIKTPVTLSVI